MGVLGGGESNSSSRRSTRQVLAVEGSTFIPKLNLGRESEPKIVLFDKDVTSIHPHIHGSMIMTVHYDNSDIKRVLIDLGSSTDVLFWDAFERLRLDPYDLCMFQCFMIGFYGEQVQLKCPITFNGV